MAVKTGDYSMIQPALEYLQRTYGLPAAHIKNLNVSTDYAGVTELNLTVYVQAEDLARPEDVQQAPDERLRVVPLVKVPMRDERPTQEAYAIGTCAGCSARIWAYGLDFADPGPAGSTRYDFTDWRGCSDRIPHTTTPTLIVPTREP